MFEFACDKCGKTVIIEDLAAIAKDKARGITYCPHCHASIADEKIVAHAKIRATEMIHTALDSLQARRKASGTGATTIIRELQTHS
ncbi:hypothetical protein [Phytobacter diazotrophicus]|uniref:hypothetical protein n=1 Tax=Phytobacter diazotrophicus TaxID=395631 RepID=UPI000892E3B7|nr:hypothetical protein [Phytobacter diazotrophicus]AUU90944.1 hypothetical protein C2U55_18695 [Enterobacteriaceae bacterium ENNIH3]AUV09012.1 hypothetical protein C2U52_23460 [Enterobacteriaceae bacterium ENNIH2]PWF50591.1 hypothetical protein BHT19_0006255 [[Kluyvera] intestini]SLK08191.1 hypothetical protein SAMN03159434_106180 [Enterobacter sp. NFR05]MDV2900210.1 hypothetical protein [Phytobacter diazotrophicus]